MASITDRPRKRLSQKQTSTATPCRATRNRPARPGPSSPPSSTAVHHQLPKPVHTLFDPLATGLSPPDPSPLRPAGPGRHPHPGRPHHLQPAPHAWAPWPPATPAVITASSPAPLVLPRPGTPLRRRRPGPVRSPRARSLLAGDDTVTEHPGPQVYGKGCHRDPVRSTHSFTAFRWGHKWVVLALLVRFPCAHPALGLAAAGGPVSARGRGPTASSATAQDPGATAGADAPRPDALVPRPDVRLHRRRQLRHPRAGRVGRGQSPAADPRQQVLPRCQPVRAAAAVLGPRPSAGSRGRSCPSPAEVVARHAASGHAAEGRLVRRGPTPRRGGDRPRLAGIQAAGRWSRCAGSSSTTGPGRTATSTSSRPTRR